MLLPGKLTTLYTSALGALDSLPEVDLDPQTVLADYDLSSGTLSQPSGHALLLRSWMPVLF